MTKKEPRTRVPLVDNHGADAVEGTEGQDRESYTDTQDRENYVPDEEADEETAGEVAAEPQAERVRGQVLWNGPYTTDGASVLDADGVRVALCGYDHNRTTSGPSLAEQVARGFNRLRW